MMFNMPLFTPPFYRRYPPPRYTMPMQYSHPKSNVKSLGPPPTPTEKQHISKKEPQKEPEDLNENPQVFNILGITFAFDDILILCLLFFLYSEGVQDEMLYIVLILLLLG